MKWIAIGADSLPPAGELVLFHLERGRYELGHLETGIDMMGKEFPKCITTARHRGVLNIQDITHWAKMVGPENKGRVLFEYPGFSARYWYEKGQYYIEVKGDEDELEELERWSPNHQNYIRLRKERENLWSMLDTPVGRQWRLQISDGTGYTTS